MQPEPGAGERREDDDRRQDGKDNDQLRRDAGMWRTEEERTEDGRSRSLGGEADERQR